jgi:hypothetical protein
MPQLALTIPIIIPPENAVIFPANNNEISGLGLNGATTSSIGLISGGLFNNININNNIFTSGNTGVNLQATGNIFIENNIFSSQVEAAINIAAVNSGGTNVLIENNVISSIAILATGIEVTSNAAANNISVQNNVINITNEGLGIILFQDSATTASATFFVKRNSISLIGGVGIDAANSSVDSATLILQDNTISGATTNHAINVFNNAGTSCLRMNGNLGPSGFTITNAAGATFNLETGWVNSGPTPVKTGTITSVAPCSCGSVPGEDVCP